MTNFIKKISFPFFLIATIISTSYIGSVMAWSDPTGTPPNNNTSAPLNIGNSTQTKDGILKVLGFKSWGPTIIVPNTMDSYSMVSSLLFGVNGSIGAKQYCDENGNNCFGLSNQDWQVPEMGYNWSKFPNFYYARYYKDNNSIVHIKGNLIEVYNFPASYPMFTLPSGYRPSEDMIIPIIIGKELNFSNNSGVGYYYTGSLKIGSDGQVGVIDKGGATLPSAGDLRYYLGSISFRAEQ